MNAGILEFNKNYRFEIYRNELKVFRFNDEEKLRKGKPNPVQSIMV
jgi:hypothetical protein